MDDVAKEERREGTHTKSNTEIQIKNKKIKEN
jgi:hypothetical protein